MKKHLLIPVLCLALLFTACSGTRTSGSHHDSIRVYRPIKSDYQTSDELVECTLIPTTEGTDPVQGAAYALSATPEEDRLSSPLPAGIRIISAEKDGSEVKVYLSTSYYLLSGMKKTVLDYCITLTMCSIDGVDSVSTYVGNEVFESGMRAEDVLLKNTVESAQSAEIRLYFPSAEGKLRCEYRSISLEDESSPERAAADALTAGPESPELYPALPAGTVLLSVYTQDGVCFVSLSEGFVSACEEQPELSSLWVYSLVNTLCSLSAVNSVQLLIEGKTVDTVGKCDISRPLGKNEKLTGSPVMA